MNDNDGKKEREIETAHNYDGNDGRRKEQSRGM